jgi:hypothetical protein
MDSNRRATLSADVLFIIATVASLAACLLAVFNQRPVTSYVSPALPIGLQKMVLALRLMARGFSSTTVGSAQPQPIASRPDHAKASVLEGHP